MIPLGNEYIDTPPPLDYELWEQGFLFKFLYPHHLTCSPSDRKFSLIICSRISENLGWRIYFLNSEVWMLDPAISYKVLHFPLGLAEKVNKMASPEKLLHQF